MADQDLIDFGILREMDKDTTNEESKGEALDASLGVIEEYREKGASYGT